MVWFCSALFCLRTWLPRPTLCTCLHSPRPLPPLPCRSLLSEQYHPSQSLGFNYAHKENRDQAPPTPMLSNLWPRKKPLGRAQYTALCHEAMKSLTLNNCGTGYQTARTPPQSPEALHNSEASQMFRPLRENLYVFYH